MTAAFLTIYLVSKMDNSKQAQRTFAYPAQKVRSEDCLGAGFLPGINQARE